MGKARELTDREKELLNVIGSHPDASLKELVNRTSYKRTTTVSRKLQQFKEQGILFGPVYQTDYGKLCKNPLHGLECIVEFNQSYETVMSYLMLIEPLLSMYPILSPRQKALLVGFLSSNDAETEALLQLLKDKNIITNYIMRVLSTMPVKENPNFFGDPTPSLKNVLTPCELPDMSFGYHCTDWSECDIAILPYMERGTMLMEILRKELKLNKEWTYEQLRYSRNKMLTNGLIEKVYQFSPYPNIQCVPFFLFFKTDDITVTQGILCNFARGERVYREYALFGKWGGLACISHPLFLTDLMRKLDRIDEITEVELYPFRYISPEKSYISYLREYKYFDVDTQTLEYPYAVYKEKIREKIESE